MIFVHYQFRSYLGQAFFHNIILNSYGPLIKFLPQTLANRSHGGYAGIEQWAPTAADAPQPMTLTSDAKDADDDYASASGSDQQPIEEASPHDPDGANDSDIEHTGTPLFTIEARASSPSPSTRPMKAEGPTDFSHPAAVEEQRIIWLPEDPLGLIHEIKRELTSHNILYSTEGAEIDSKGCVNVTMAPPEEVRRNGGETSAI